MERTTLAAAGIPTAVAALMRAYTGYFVPIHFSEETFGRYIPANDIDPDASPIWLHDGAPAAVGIAGIRGDRGWVGAFGIALEFRGQGLAQAMFAEFVRHIKRRGALHVQLEVLDKNERAIQIYERAGFTVTRELLSLESPKIEPDPGAADEIDADETLGMPDGTQLPHCWQREPASLERRVSHLRAVARGSSYALFRADGGPVALLKCAIAEPDAGALFAALAARSGNGKIAIVNEPQGSPLLALLTAHAWTPVHRQYEMHLRL